MSITYINFHDENVFDWAEQEPEKIIKPDKYTSTNKKRVQFERQPVVKYDYESNKQILQINSKLYSHKTMGYPEVPLSGPCNFLRKNKGVKFQKTPNHKCSSGSSPPVPKRSEQNIFTYKKKNFQQINKEMIHKFKPKQPKPKVAFTRYGSTYELCNSGVMASYVYSPNFGKTPNYVKKIKKSLEKEHLEEIKRQKPKFSLPAGIRYLSNEERSNVMNGLRKNWWETTLHFNTIPSIVDTIPMKLRKHATEMYLRQLEQDLLLLENNPVIYICDQDLQKSNIYLK